MTLSKYYKSLSRKERAKVAKLAGIGVDYLYQLSTGFRRASPDTAKRLEKATDGKITKEQLRPDIWDD